MKKSIIKNLKRKARKNFTLLELLIIVAILAIVGGGLVTSFEGLQAQAAKASATNTIASLQNSIRTYQTLEGKLPNNLDSLLAAVPTGATSVNGVVTASTITSYVGPNLTDTTLGGIELANYLGSSKMGKKVKATALSHQQVQNLVDAGITTVRYLDKASLKGGTLTIPDAANAASQTIGAIADIDIPQLGFNVPRPGGNRNRGRAFEVNNEDLFTTVVVEGGEDTISTTQQFAVWGGQNAATPVADYDNTKVGADPLAVLVAFGIGPDSTLVAGGKTNPSTADSKTLGDAGRIASAPFYGDVAKNTYPSYVMLVDVQQSPAKFVAVVDARGDFLAEEFAEQSGQKL